MPHGKSSMALYSIGSIVSGNNMHGIVVNVQPSLNSFLYTCAAEQLYGGTWTSLEDALSYYPLSLGSTLAMIGGFHNTWVATYPHVASVVISKVAGRKRRRRRGHAEPTDLYHYPSNMDFEDRQRHSEQGQYPKFMSAEERQTHREQGQFPKHMSAEERRRSMNERIQRPM